MEAKLKIKPNVTKNKLIVQGVFFRTLMVAGGITLNNQSIPIKELVKIMGYNQTRSTISTGHITSLTAKAPWQLKKLQRFRSVPSKLYLYKALIKPLIEYLAILLADSSEIQIKRLQIIQYKALRFIYDVRWSVMATNDSLLQRTKITNIKTRLEHLQYSVNFKQYL